METIRAYSKEKEFSRENYERVAEFARASHARLGSERWLAFRLENIGNSIIGLAAFFCVLSKGYISPALAGVALVYTLDMSSNLAW
jgi:hypothetical protein